MSWEIAEACAVARALDAVPRVELLRVAVRVEQWARERHVQVGEGLALLLACADDRSAEMPRIEARIETLYARLAELSGSQEEVAGDSAARVLLELRALQERQAAEMKRAFAARQALDVDLASSRIGRADELLAKHGNPSAGTDAGSHDPD